MSPQQGTPGTAENAQRAAENAQRALENAQQAADRAQRAADQAIRDGAPTPPSPPDPPAAPDAPVAPSAPGQGPIIFTSDNGRNVSIDMQGGNLVLSQEGRTQVIPLRDVVPRGAVQIAWTIPATLSILLIWWPISRAVVGWLRRKHAADHASTELEARLRERLDAMERNIDTVAVEVERLSEGQRFTNKLLAERPMAVPVEVPRGVPVGVAGAQGGAASGSR